MVNATGGDAEYVELDSPHGHDAFLLEEDAIGPPMAEFLESVEKDEA